MKKIVAISGKAGHGKDTAAMWMKRQLEAEDNRVAILHFADIVKFTCSKYYGWDGEKNDEGRALLQKVGTDLRLKHNPSCWASMTNMLIELMQDDFDYFLIPDMRFIIEYTALCIQWGGTNVATVRVNRTIDGFPYVGPGINEQTAKHASETELDTFHFNFIMQNDGTERFKKSCQFVVNQIMSSVN